MDMVTCVAQAILRRRYFDCEPDAYGNDFEVCILNLDPDHIIDAHDEARAAIEAMRDLDETTFALAMHEIDDKRGPQREGKQVFREFFGAVFDAALSSTKESGE